MWLAGQIGENADEVRDVREELLASYVKLVHDLIPVNEQMILERLRRQSS